MRVKLSIPNAPSVVEIVAARESAGLSHSSAGAVVHVTRRTWQRWEYGEQPIPPGLMGAVQAQDRDYWSIEPSVSSWA